MWGQDPGFRVPRAALRLKDPFSWPWPSCALWASPDFSGSQFPGLFRRSDIFAWACPGGWTAGCVSLSDGLSPDPAFPDVGLLLPHGSSEAPERTPAPRAPEASASPSVQWATVPSSRAPAGRHRHRGAWPGRLPLCVFVHVCICQRVCVHASAQRQPAG